MTQPAMSVQGLSLQVGRDRLSTNVHFASIPTVNSGLWDLSRWATSGREQSAANEVVRLFDHLVGAGEQPRWHVEAKRLGGLVIDDQLELRRL